MNNGIYIYGFIRTSEPQEFGAIGIGDTASTVRTLGYKDIAAVVSDSPFVVYNSLKKEKTVKDLVTHQFVLEKVMERFTVVPVKFGMMVETEAEAIAFMEKGYTLLSSELSKIEGKIEMDVVASWDLSKILATISRHNLQVQEKQKELAMKGAKASVEDKIALGKVIEQAVQAEKSKYQQVILQTLKEGAEDVRLHNVANDEMIFNAGFLLARKDKQLFTEALNTLDRDMENMVNFRLIGPLPLYSFSTILLEKIDPRKFEEARKLFGLDGEITDKKVRDTYHQLVRKCHPDKGGKADSLDFHLVHAGYKTLKDFTAKGLVHVGVYQWESDMQ
jgi:hypothetical protein